MRYIVYMSGVDGSVYWEGSENQEDKFLESYGHDNGYGRVPMTPVTNAVRYAFENKAEFDEFERSV